MAHKVRMYTLSTCSHCKAAKKFMRDNGIDFEFNDVDLLQGVMKEKVLNEITKYNPQRSFPTIIIDKKIIVGFRENDIKAALDI